MLNYEIRLFGDDGNPLLVYVTRCSDDELAMKSILAIQAFPHRRFEMWCDERKVAEGQSYRTLN
ncbi:MAG TPA: hypothetical protein VIJ85_07860 [Rhizomicrobium sp.]